MGLTNLAIKPLWHKGADETPQPTSIRQAPGAAETQSSSEECCSKNSVAAGLKKLKRSKREYKTPQSELSKFFFGPREKPPLKQRILVVLARLALCLLMLAFANAIIANA